MASVCQCVGLYGTSFLRFMSFLWHSYIILTSSSYTCTMYTCTMYTQIFKYTHISRERARILVANSHEIFRDREFSSMSGIHIYNLYLGYFLIGKKTIFSNTISIDTMIPNYTLAVILQTSDVKNIYRE